MTEQSPRPAHPSEPALSEAELEDAAAHLDEDVEAWEDPVHSGDVRHQHETHQHHREPEPAPEDGAG